MTLQRLVTSILAPSPHHVHVSELARLFHRIATVYLKKKSASGSLNPDFLGLSVEDIAWDCIAELFRRDVDGQFTQLADYYSAFDLKTIPEEELLGQSRRLVFSKVNQELYRQYKENDPGLHKVLRNLKDNVLKVSTVSLESVNDELCLIFGEDDNVNLPVMPPEILEAYLTAIIKSDVSLINILRQSAELFVGRSVYRKTHPLVAYGRALRSAWSRVGSDVTDTVQPENSLSHDEIRRSIAKSVHSVKSSMRATYVDKGKLSSGDFDGYFNVVQEIIETEYISGDGEAVSYFELFAVHFVNVPMERYRSAHRTRLEYLVKLTRRGFLELIRREL